MQTSSQHHISQENHVKIGPSILSADFGKLNEEVATVDEYADFIHADVMDGHFVPNLTFGAPVVAKLQSKLPVECHLMISEPEKYVEDFVKAGAWMITIHVEACSEKTGEVLEQIRGLGVKVGLSLNPGTKVEEIEPYLDMVDMVLVMTVEPGFGGQSFMHECLNKIKWVREKKPNLAICVDGGVKDDTAKLCVEAGANMLV
ncbi:ribulose-phosphate 3-epimerase, partial [Candidatus Peregrinibacteria bacterium]|nr:ribulose-phosphate 3-epimerase [Candidatus Peregrinibacteria bacterium]